jgi:tocopherol cyclase
MMLPGVLQPERFHGHRARPPFFEGWYYKLVDPHGRHRLAVIPGLFLSPDPAERYAFVQVLDGAGRTEVFRYPREEFQAARDRFEVRVGDSLFTERSLRLDLHGSERAISGEIGFVGTVPWPVTLRSPGIMGWYAWVPFMECYHGVVSLDHVLEGALALDDDVVSFTGGRGYIEKDWGRSFPAGYIWLQSNHFPEPGVSLTGSIAVIPWLGGAFPGFIVGLLSGERLYRFATYTGARTEALTITDDAVVWTMADRHLRLCLEATRARGGLLLGPTREHMHGHVDETLSAEVAVVLTSITGGRTLYEGIGRHAGLEVQGDTTRLLALQRSE